MNIAEKYRSYLQDAQEPSDRLELAHNAIDCFQQCEINDHFTAAELAPIIEAAVSRYKFVFETGGALLVALARRNSVAQQALLRMASDRKVTARFHAVAFLERSLPERLCAKIIELALSDTSPKVRCMGVQRAEELKFSSFVSQLEQMLETESHPDVVRSLECHLPVLRDGYRLEPSLDGTGYNLTFRSDRGSFGGPYIPKEKCNKEYIEHVIEERRKKPWL